MPGFNLKRNRVPPAAFCFYIGAEIRHGWVNGDVA